jgi:hypothetical protein
MSSAQKIDKDANQQSEKSPPLPSNEKISAIAEILHKKFAKEERERKYASVKQVLALLGMGAFLTMAMIAPGIAYLGKEFLKEKKRKEKNKWKKYNLFYLRRTIRRLRRQKLVEVVEENGQQIVRLTKNGKRKILKYSLENLEIPKPKSWDGRWRLVIWDVPMGKNYFRKVFREALHSLGFLQLQESVFLYPYPCEDQITFLREYYGVGNEVIYIIAQKIEDDSPYRVYFGLE